VASAAYQRRDARARALGYASYYDYRAHDNGRIPPSQPRLTGSELKRARGHASAADAISTLHGGHVELAMLVVERRHADGRASQVRLTLLMDDRTDQEFILQGPALERERILDLIAAMKAAGIDRISHYVVKQLHDIANADEPEPDEFDEGGEVRPFDEGIPF
jgi:hypothetical protein